MRHGVILQLTDELSGGYVVDLGAAIATSSDEFAIVAEPYAAHHTGVVQGVDELNVQRAWHVGVGIVEHVPIVVTDGFEIGWKLLNLKFGELVANALDLGEGVLEVGGNLRISVDGQGGAGDAWKSRMSACLEVKMGGGAFQATSAKDGITLCGRCILQR